MNKEIIEKTADAARERVWEYHTSVQQLPIKSPAELLDPRWACYVEGINVSYEDDLGRFGNTGDRFEVAGSISRQDKKISISKRFNQTAQRFTLAHELGHWHLHPTNVIQHRDRLISDSDHTSHIRAPHEKEADFFASCFLMPRNTVISMFKQRFGNQLPFRFDDTAAFWLRREDPDSLIFSEKTSLDRALTLATCTHYSGQTFLSLSNLFGVSSTAMAIRLTELQLIRWP